MPNNAYEKHKLRSRERQADQAQTGRDIGAVPAIREPDRRNDCCLDLKKFLETYFPLKFSLGWSEDHFLIISKIEKSVTEGGLFALAMPRGSGKTTISVLAALWALFYGHRKFVVLIGATEDAAKQMLDEIKIEIECNELLLADFPEICYPIRKIEGIANRCNGQLCNGNRTRITWTDGEVVLPTIADSIASGSVIQVRGITGRIRGMKAALADGRSIRPELVLIDDPQTDESANSPEQNRKRVRVLSGAILGLAGPGVKISGVMPCTVIRPDDMADQILNKEHHPEWNGERRKLLVDFPANMEIWDRYREVWAESLRMHGDIRDATNFYLKNREEMDRGAKVAWEDRHEPDEISALQYAMNKYCRDPETFFAEFQNEPLPENDDTVDAITIQHVWEKMNNRPQGEIPVSCNTLTMFIDVQKNLLYYTVMAFDDGFSGYVIDYGAYPDQKRRYFSLSDANPTYSMVHHSTGLEGAIYAALESLTHNYLTKAFRREDGAEIKIQRCMIDSAWGRSTDAIYQFCRESDFSAILMPTKGMFVSATAKPISEYIKNVGDKIGEEWYIPNVRKKRTVRCLLYDTNFWKSFFRERLFTSRGDKGSFTLYGNGRERHRMFAEQLASETSEPVSGRNRKVDIWKLIPGRDNHFLDCVVGCHVAASEQGCKLLSIRSQKHAPTSDKPRKFVASGRKFVANS